MQTISIAANFTIEPIENPLKFWIRELSLSAELNFAPYNQIFQQLLDPSSIFFKDPKGLNVVFLRLQDWFNTSEKDGIETVKEVKRNLQDLQDALEEATRRSSTPFLLCFCPSSPDLPQEQRAIIKEFEEGTVSILNKTAGLYGIASGEILSLYTVEHFADTQSEILGHIPYTASFYAVLASIVARRLYAIQNKPYKVIVLDCDNTLWKGVIGEDGPQGVEISASYQALQEFMIAQHRAGMLLCLCSKNQESDVFEVFDQRSDMRLQRSHIVSWRINWMSKSQNIKSLAAELKLGLDSFLLVDDNPVECAEVQAGCPEILTAQIPTNLESIPIFLSHFWGFDHVKVTQEDLQRTAFYQQDVQRERLRQQVTTYSDFLANLELQVEISPMRPQQLGRVSQLTHRTNQFNASTIRRSESEIQQLIQLEGYQCLTVQAKDRFGDYGLVGVIIFRINAQTLNIDTFLLSCRALGRGVEHLMLASMGKTAQEHQCSVVEIAYLATKRNQPFFNFIESVGSAYKNHQAEYQVYEFPAEYVASIVFSPISQEVIEPSLEISDDKAGQAVNNSASRIELLNRIANTLNSAEQILAMVNARAQRSRSTFSLPPYRTPKNPIEKRLTELWAGILVLDHIGVDDNFFDLGGGSLLATQLISRINEDFNLHLPIQSVFDAPTIGTFAKYIETLDWMQTNSFIKDETLESTREEGEI